jgi:hypothetical protein
MMAEARKEVSFESINIYSHGQLTHSKNKISPIPSSPCFFSLESKGSRKRARICRSFRDTDDRMKPSSHGHSWFRGHRSPLAETPELDRVCRASAVRYSIATM